MASPEHSKWHWLYSVAGLKTVPVAEKVKKQKEPLLQPRSLAVEFIPFNLGYLRFPFCGEIGWVLAASSSAWLGRDLGLSLIHI